LEENEEKQEAGAKEIYRDVQQTKLQKGNVSTAEEQDTGPKNTDS
jgi:hypothetical protein